MSKRSLRSFQKFDCGHERRATNVESRDTRFILCRSPVRNLHLTNGLDSISMVALVPLRLLFHMRTRICVTRYPKPVRLPFREPFATLFETERG